MQIAAFISHQLGASGGKTFGEYLEGLGLVEAHQQKPAPVDDTATLASMGITVKKVKR